VIYDSLEEWSYANYKKEAMTRRVRKARELWVCFECNHWIEEKTRDNRCIGECGKRHALFRQVLPRPKAKRVK